MGLKVLTIVQFDGQNELSAFLDRFDVRCVGSAIVIKLDSLNLTNFGKVWGRQEMPRR